MSSNRLSECDVYERRFDLVGLSQALPPLNIFTIPDLIKNTP